MQRRDGRSYECVRSLKVMYDVFPHADGSVLFEMGNTKVLVAITLQASVPSFLRGKKTGWLTAEYALLPAATHVRNMRESNATSRQGRSVEISRFIGRVFRSVCDLSVLGERTVTIDCDVFQADGSTRAASVNGAYLALRVAEQKWLKNKIINKSFLREPLTAVSVGVAGSNVLVDVDYEEDVVVDADLTFVLAGNNNIIELQGTAERVPCSWQSYEQAYAMACKGIEHIRTFIDSHRSVERPYTEVTINKNKPFPLYVP